MKRTLRSFALAASVACLEHAALAAVVVVDDFSGPKSKQVREAVSRAIEKADHQLVKESAARVPATSDESVYVKRATEYRAAAFVDGAVEEKKAGWSVTLTVHNGADGKILGDTTLKAARLPKLLKKISEEAATNLAASIDQGSAPELEKQKPAEANETPAPKPEPEEKAEPAEPAEKPHDEPPPPPEDQEKKPVLLELSGGLQFFSRSFEYHQDVNGSLHPYHISLWPALEARAGYYPGAHFTRNMAANIGLVAGISRSVGASSSIGGNPTDYGTTLQELIIGARFRVPIARYEFAASLLYGDQSFEIESDHDPIKTAANGLPVNRGYVPDASYQYLRPGLDARLAFGRLRFGAGLGYRVVLGMGQLTSPAWFPHATAQALDGFVTAGFEVVPNLYATAGFDATRYALDMHTVPADRSAARDIAGGAIDQYLTVHLGVEYRLGASGASATARVAERARRSDGD